MILDLRKLKRSGKDQMDFFFEYAPKNQIIDIPNADFLGVAKITGNLALTGDHSCFLQGQVEFAIKGQCTRCLKDTENSFIAEFSESLEENNLDGYSVKNDTVDLTEIVDDILAMNIPISFLCDENCKGLCAGCGTNLNDGECKCNK